jgi:hypothetical protein
MKINITGGREVSPTVELVDSNYYAGLPTEKLITISGPVSISTLEDIIKWAKRECKVVKLKKDDRVVLLGKDPDSKQKRQEIAKTQKKGLGK